MARRTDPAQFSGIRILALNDIYIVDRNFTSSVSKCFSTKVHTLLKSTSSFDAYLPTRRLNWTSKYLLPLIGSRHCHCVPIYLQKLASLRIF